MYKIFTKQKSYFYLNKSMFAKAHIVNRMHFKAFCLNSDPMMTSNCVKICIIDIKLGNSVTSKCSNGVEFGQKAAIKL